MGQERVAQITFFSLQSVCEENRGPFIRSTLGEGVQPATGPDFEE